MLFNPMKWSNRKRITYSIVCVIMSFILLTIFKNWGTPLFYILAMISLVFSWVAFVCSMIIWILSDNKKKKKKEDEDYDDLEDF